MKITLRVPTRDQYAFVEAEFDLTEGEGASDIAAKYYELIEQFKDREGLSEKDFSAFIDRQIMGESNHVEDYEKASQEQKKFIQILKRALKRGAARITREINRKAE
jgi:hypothetical protein